MNATALPAIMLSVMLSVSFSIVTLSIIMLNFVILSSIRLNFVILSVIMMNFVMLSVVMLSVVVSIPTYKVMLNKIKA
jgi:hypothetical protein